MNSIDKAAFAGKAAMVIGLALIAGACGDDASVDESAGPGFEPAFDCEGLADRWVVIHQTYLDELGDLSARDLDPPAPAASRAAQSLANSVIEQARDAESVGCGDRLVSGSPLLCARVERLMAHGEAGEAVVAQLQSACPPG